ncbi:aldehyde dehydrogenase family protein [Paraburkholderia sp. RL18-101-BIB-B]|uniref:aldehyde dehydrogenase family protein n=1 Tax=unclassified Paraburkholderia TaxID=2615204 RepID=UPI0038B9CBE7
MVETTSVRAGDETGLRDYPLLIDGQLGAGVRGEWAVSLDPADETPIGRSAIADADDVERAVSAAERAQPSWAALDVSDRAERLRELARRLMQRRDEILQLEVRDTGNTIGKMRGDLAGAVHLLEYYASIACEIKGETLPFSKERLHLSMREPFGVVARIVPFNHPIYFEVAALAGPLMAGNAALIKPPEQSPLSSAILGEVCADVLPAGIVNILPGPGQITGDAIVRHPRVRRIAFTGSVGTGMMIQRRAAEVCVKQVSLELGGKNPMIVFPDVDPDVAANAAIAGMNFAWQGQSCGSTSRLLLHESIHDAVVERVVAAVSSLKLGDPLDETSQMGPINSERHYRRVLEYIDIAKSDGAHLATGGKRPPGESFGRGYWVEPTVFTGVTRDMRIAREEVFGPVLSVLKWRSPDEALALANATEYGLAAALWSNDLNAALKIAMKLDCGYVWVNGGGGHYTGMPFGGTKNSGVGREECMDELLSYTRQKSLHVTLR